MAVRQYIGARYVTKIYENSLDPSSAEWEASVTYEPLTMVTYNNSSYLSKKDVPGSVGNPADNPSYWIVTGAYNGQIAALQNQIDTINATIGDSSSGIIKDIDDLDAAIDVLNDTTIPDIQQSILDVSANMLDVEIGPSYFTGTTDLSDHNIHQIASVNLEADKYYMLIFKVDIYHGSESDIEHIIELEWREDEDTISSFAQGRRSYSTVIENSKANVPNVVSFCALLHPAVNRTIYVFARDRSSAATGLCYPMINCLNFG